MPVDQDSPTRSMTELSAEWCARWTGPMRRLQVEVTLARPVALGPVTVAMGGVPLDSVLGASLAELLRPGPIVLPRGAPLDPIQLPLLEHGGVWCASVLRPAGDEPYWAGWIAYHKSTYIGEAIELLRERRLPRSSGPYRAQQGHVWVITPRTMVATAIGHQEAVAELLGGIVAVGAMRGHGYGVLHQWTVSVIDDDTDPAGVLVDQTGRVTRPVPVALAERLGASGWRMDHPVRPPYWSTEGEPAVLQ